MALCVSCAITFLSTIDIYSVKRRVLTTGQVPYRQYRSVIGTVVKYMYIDDRTYSVISMHETSHAEMDKEVQL